MKLFMVPNSWYCDALPSGARVAQIHDAGLVTDRGDVPRSPGGDLLQLRLAPDGIRFAGHGGNNEHVYEWTGTQWRDVGIGLGNNCAIYGADSALHVVTSLGGPTGATGYRYVEDGTGRLVASWETYDPSTPMSKARGLTDIWEWTEHGDVIIGQGESDVIVKYRGQTYVLYESPNVIMVRYNRSGDAISVAAVDQARRCAVCAWFTVQEIPSLKRQATSSPSASQSHSPSRSPSPSPSPSRSASASASPSPEPPPGPSPMRDNRYWFQPNVRSNILDLFTRLDILGNVGVFEFAVQNIDGNPAAGPNSFDALVGVDAFKKLRDQGIALSIGMGVVKEWDPTGEANLRFIDEFMDKIRRAGGELAYLSMDEPMTANKDYLHQPIEAIADITAKFIRKAQGLGLKVAWDEAWPHVTLEEMRDFLDLLDAVHGAPPNYIHYDMDHKLQMPTAADVQAIADFRTDLAWKSGVILAGYKHATDEEYRQDVLAWAQQLHALGMPMDHVCVMSWVDGFEQPRNETHIQLLNQVKEIFQ
jgi:hypothetical protein